MQKALNIASAETLALKKNTDSGFFLILHIPFEMIELDIDVCQKQSLCILFHR